MTRLSVPYRTRVPVCHSPGGATQLRMRTPGTSSCARTVRVTTRPRALAHRVDLAMVASLTPSTRVSFLALFERGHKLLRRDGAVALLEPPLEGRHRRVPRAVDLRRHPAMFAE